MPAVEALRHIPTFHRAALGQSPAPLTVSTGVVQSQELPPKKDDEELVTTEIQGIPAIPPKVIKCILEGDYVDMAELLPDTWRLEELMLQHRESSQCSANTKPRRKPVTDILTWVECFSNMAAIITSKYLSKAPQLWAYQRTIVRASQNFDGPSWVAYDMQFRRKAASKKSWDWGEIDLTLYNEMFTGRARAKVHCRICLSKSHLERACPLAPPPGLMLSTPNNNQFASHPQQGRGPLAPNSLRQNSGPVELCGLFNKLTGNECTYHNCKFTHVCSLCRQGPHPAAQCQRPRRTLLSDLSMGGHRFYPRY